MLVDEVYLDALFDRPHRSAIHLGPHVVVTSSLTKVYGLSGLRCGWILAEPELAGRIWRLVDLFYNIQSHLSERASVVALRELPRLRARAQAIMTGNIRLFNQFLTAEAGRLACPPHVHGLVAFPRLVGASADELCALLREHYDTSVVPGRFFGSPGHVRIGLGRETETLRKGLENIRAALGELERRT
jgi:aspartate/methionine/tyrosine aminotransferase